MIAKKIPSWAVVLLILMVIIAVALWLRVGLPYNQVFVKDWVKMTGVDAYYYMRLVDNLMKHFPQLTQFDPYLQYPGGAVIGNIPDFFAYFMAGIIWLLGMGHPDQHMVDVIAVYIPPILAMLTIIAVYFIGRMLGSGWIGLMAAGLLAIMPGEFLNRSLLGYTDHHIAEVLFTTVMMLFVFEYIRLADGKTLAELRRGSGRVQAKLLACGVLGGVFLWVYILTWQGALMVVIVLFIFQVAQAVVDHMKGRSVDYLGVLGICVYGAALVLYMPWMKGAMTAIMLGIGLLLSVFLMALSGFMVRKQIKAIYYPAGIAVAGIAGLIAMRLLNPLMLSTMLGYATGIFGWYANTTVMEMQPLLLQQGQFTFLVAFGNYMLAFILSIVGIGILVYQVAKGGPASRMLLLIWSVFILLTALGMRRFAYYYAVNVALLSAYVCWIPLSLLMQKKQVAAALAVHKGTTAKSRRKAERQNAKPKVKRNTVLIALLLATIALLVYYPVIGPLPDGQKPAVDLATRPLFAPSNAWCETTDWLRDNTEEPFGKPETYYGLYKPVNEKGGFEYPSSGYGILAWWDYGYWIAKIGQRAPASNPGTGNLGEASYFTAQDWPSAARVIDTWGTHYVIVDNEIAAFDGKFHALATLSGSSYSAFYDVFLQKQDSKYVSMILFYPEYYRSMVSRLYNFDGKAVVPDAVNVITYSEVTAQDGRKYKEITEFKTFSSYNEAQKFILDNKSKNYFIVGQDPYKSSVPLEELKGYKLVYGSNQKVSTGSKPQSNIKIFEYKKDVIPLAGDWNGDGKSKTGLWQADGYFILDRNGDDQLVRAGPFGYSTDVPLAGDWNGDGRDEIGVWRPSDLCFYLDYNGNSTWDAENGDKKIGPFGWSFNDRPVTGDWNGDGRDETGVWRPKDLCFYLDVKGDGKWDTADKSVKFGPFGGDGDVPVAGDWNGDGRDEVGVWEPASRLFLLDMNGNGTWDTAKGDIKVGPFGDAYDTPLNGRWEGGKKDLAGIWDPENRTFVLNIKGDYSFSGSSNIRIKQFAGY